MYIEITTRCNMSCAHCCMRATAKGKDMSRDTFLAALKQASESGEHVSLGGGEPTLHPLFWEFLGLSVGTVETVWLATNGSMKATAIALARMARKGVIGCALSQDPWHDPIDVEVVEAFKREPDKRPWLAKEESDYREIRDVSRNIDKMAPWRDPEEAGDPSVCACEEILVRTNGDVYICGCPGSIKLGDVFKGIAFPKHYSPCECYRKQSYRQEST